MNNISYRYQPGSGQSVVYFKRDDGVTYSRFKEYHGPWPAPPKEQFGPPPPVGSPAYWKINPILEQFGIEMELSSCDDIHITFRYKGETIADDEYWSEY